MTTGALPTRAWRPMAAAYLCLVGLPVVAVPLMLSHGRRLQPPPGLAGEWQVDAAAVLGGLPCTAARNAVPADPVVLGIVQSGRTLDLRLGNMAGSGRVDGANVTARLTPRSADPPCQGQAAGEMALQAAMEPLVGPVALVGSLRLPACASCSVIPFRAVRSRTASPPGEVPR